MDYGIFNDWVANNEAKYGRFGRFGCGGLSDLIILTGIWIFMISLPIIIIVLNKVTLRLNRFYWAKYIIAIFSFFFCTFQFDSRLLNSGIESIAGLISAISLIYCILWDIKRINKEKKKDHKQVLNKKPVFLIILLIVLVLIYILGIWGITFNNGWICD